MRTLIAIPTMGKVETSFFNSMMYLKRTSQDAVLTVENSLVYDARNHLAQKAVEAKAKYILWLDSDMVFEPDMLERMHKSIGDKDFLCGLFFKRRPKYNPCIYKTAGYKRGEGKEIIPTATAYDDYPEDKVFEISACGFACVLMKTEMFTKIMEQRGLPFSPVEGFGEDISFCIKARECGYKLYCDSSIKVGHTAQFVVDDSVFKVWRDRDVKQG